LRRRKRAQSEFKKRMPFYGTISLAAIAFVACLIAPSVAAISLLAGTVFFLIDFACLGAWAWRRSHAKNKGYFYLWTRSLSSN